MSTLYVGGIEVILKSPEGDKLKYAAHLQYQTTNNKVEYEALLKRLKLAKSLGGRVNSRPRRLSIDNGTCETKEDWMKKYLSKVKRLINKFKEASFLHLLSVTPLEDLY